MTAATLALLFALASANTESTLKNGLTIVALPAGSDVVSVALTLSGGASLDESRHGESYVAHALFFGEAGRSRGGDLATKLQQRGAELKLAVEPHRVLVRVTGVSSMLDEIVELLATVSSEVDLDDADAFEARRNQVVDLLWEQRRAPFARALAQVPDLAFGWKHPYGHTPFGERRTLARSSLASVKRHLATSLCPRRATLAAAGPVSLDRLTRLAKKHFGDWHRCRKKAKEVAVTVPSRRRVEVRIVPDKLRTQVLLLAAIAVEVEDDDDRAALEVIADVLGGSLSSRLQASLRARDGLTYGANAWSETWRGAGVLYVRSSIDATRVAEALQGLLEVVDGIRARPPKDAELARTVRRRETRLAVAATAPEERLTRWLSGGDGPAPSADTVAVLAAGLDAVRVQLVLVGRAKKLEKIVETSGLGTPKVLR